MQDLLANIPVVLYEYLLSDDQQGRFIYLSESAQKILGVNPADVIGNPSLMDELIHPEDYVSFAESSYRSLMAQVDWYWNGRMIIRGGERWVEMRSNLHKMDDGSILRRGVIQDVTERKDLFKESELRYQTLVERLPIGVVVHNHGKIVFANSHANAILGASQQELIGTHVLQYIYRDQRDKILNKMKEVASAPSGMLEQKYVRLDGKVIDVEASVFPFVYRGTP